MTAERSIEADVPREPAEAAAYWDSRLRSADCSETERAAFREWYRADPAHARAFDKAQAVVAALVDARNRPELRAMREDVMRDVRARRLRPRRLFGWVGGVAATLAVLAIVPLFWPSSDRYGSDPVDIATSTRIENIDRFQPPFYASSVGQVRTVRLADGSAVTLNTDSLIRERYSEGERRIDLLRGQAEFDVEHNPERPFVVQAGDRRITALGTIFDVWLHDRQVTITQIEGVIEVHALDRQADDENIKTTDLPTNALEPVRLEAGDQLIIAPDTQLQVQRLPDVSTETLWQQGRVFFEDTALADAIAEIARYSPTPIETRGLGADEFALNGMFRTTEPDEFLTAIEAAFPITVDRSNPAVVFVAKRTD